MQVTPVSKTLAEIFKESFIQIPRFQRPYDWTSENVSDFWNDLRDNRDNDYFMGSIVVFRDSKDKKLLYVVDGQQRLTTVTVFLTVLRDAFVSAGDQNLAAALQGYIQTVDDDNKQRYVLTHQTPRKLLQHGMQNADPDPSYLPSDDEERSIQNARRILDRYLADHLKEKSTPQAKIEAIRTLRQKTLDIKFISVELDNEDDAYVIFEVLNTRGKDLRVSDLLKNLLTKYLRVSVKGADPAKDKWDKIASQLDGLKGAYDIDTFIFHYWLAHEYSVAKANLFKSFKAVIKDKSSALEYLNDLYDSAPIYLRAVAPKDQKWAKEETPLRDSLIALGVFRVAQAMPLVLSVLRLYYGKYIKLKAAISAISLIEKFTFQFNAITGSRGGGGISAMYAKLAQDAWSCEDSDDFAKMLPEIRTKFAGRVPSLEEFSLGFAQLIYRNDFTRDKDLVRYVLGKIQCQLGWPKETDYDALTVEHIISQAGGLRTGANDDCGAVGNLLLVSEELNNELGTKAADDKIAILKASGLPLDERLLSASSWTYEDISNRGFFLAELGYEKIWNL